MDIRRHTLLCATALATGLALTPVTAAQALPWGLTPVATVAGAADTWSAAADTVGNSAVAWVVGNRVWVSTRSVGSLIWEAPTPVSADPAVDASVGTVSNVDIDSSPNGHLAVVWTQTPPAGSADPDSEIWQTQRPRGGSFVAPRAVVSNQNDDDHAQVDIGAGGEAWVVWLGKTNAEGESVVRATSLDATTGPGGIRALSREQGTYADLRLARGSGGALVAAWRWSDPADTTHKILAIRRNAGSWGTLTATPQAPVILDPAVAVDGQGRSWIGWSQGLSAETAVPYVTTFDTVLGALTPLGATPGRGLDLAANATGVGAATWVTPTGLGYADLSMASAPTATILTPGVGVSAGDVAITDSGTVMLGYAPAGQAQVVLGLRGPGEGFDFRSVGAVPDARPLVLARADQAIGVWAGAAGGPVQATVADLSMPTAAHLTAPLRPFNLGLRIAVGWVGADSVSPVTYTVTAARGDYKTGAGAPFVWQSTAATSAAFPARRGETVCFTVQAADAAGNLSAVSSQRCTATPIDDRALTRKKLKGKAVWKKRKQNGHFRRTYVTTSQRGAKLTLRGVRASRIALLAPRKRGYGKVEVRLGKTLLGVVDLGRRHPGVAKQQIIEVGDAFALRSGNLKIKVLSKKKTVRIDGVFAYGA